MLNNFSSEKLGEISQREFAQGELFWGYPKQKLDFVLENLIKVMYYQSIPFESEPEMNILANLNFYAIKPEIHSV